MYLLQPLAVFGDGEEAQHKAAATAFFRTRENGELMQANLCWMAKHVGIVMCSSPAGACLELKRHEHSPHLLVWGWPLGKLGGGRSKTKRKISPAGIWTRVVRVTGGNASQLHHRGFLVCNWLYITQAKAFQQPNGLLWKIMKRVHNLWPHEMWLNKLLWFFVIAKLFWWCSPDVTLN